LAFLPVEFGRIKYTVCKDGVINIQKKRSHFEIQERQLSVEYGREFGKIEKCL